MSTLLTVESYFDSKAIRIDWDKEHRYIHIEWKGYASNSEYLDILRMQLSLTKEKKANKIMYDLRKMGVVSAENQKYTNEVYFPEMAKAGSKYAAIIIPENIFGEVSVNSILGKANNALFEAKLFKDKPSAATWLIQQ